MKKKYKSQKIEASVLKNATSNNIFKKILEITKNNLFILNSQTNFLTITKICC